MPLRATPGSRLDEAALSPVRYKTDRHMRERCKAKADQSRRARPLMGGAPWRRQHLYQITLAFRVGGSIPLTVVISIHQMRNDRSSMTRGLESNSEIFLTPALRLR